MSKPLLRDLQELVRQNVISAETAEQITRYYQTKQDTSPNKFNIVLALLGALLVGSGIVLLLAHNWDLMNRFVKTIIAFVPLAIGHGLCIYTLLRKKGDRVWQESSATILFFAVATSISLVSQVYQIDGDLPAFLLLWLYLVMPVIYLLNSSIVSLLCIAGITWYACLVGYDYPGDYPWMYVLFLVYLIPHYYRFLRFYRDSSFFHWHNWALVASICVTLGTFSGRYAETGWVIGGYVALFGLLYTVGAFGFFREYKLWANPVYVVGLLGLLVIMMILSYDTFWDVGGRERAWFFFLPPINPSYPQ